MTQRTSIQTLIFILLLWPFSAVAQTYPEPTSTFVNDFAELLDPETEQRVTEALRRLKDDRDIEMTLVTIPSRSTYGNSASLAAFAKGLFNQWGVGHAERNDGILILIARDDREMRIALGDAYDAVYDGRAQRVIDTAFLPAFRKDRYAEGIEAGVASAIANIVTPYVDKVAVDADSGFEFADDGVDKRASADRWIFGGGLIAILLFGFRSKLRGLVTRFRRCPKCGTRHLSTKHTTLKKPSLTETGMRERLISCSNCDYRASTTKSLPKISRSSGGSGGSFGGGRSSGGGASGRW